MVHRLLPLIVLFLSLPAHSAEVLSLIRSAPRANTAPGLPQIELIQIYCSGKKCKASLSRDGTLVREVKLEKTRVSQFFTDAESSLKSVQNPLRAPSLLTLRLETGKKTLESTEEDLDRLTLLEQKLQGLFP